MHYCNNINYYHQRRHVRRRLVLLFMVSALPLFADDVVDMPQQPQPQQNVDDSNDSKYHHDDDDDDDIYSSSMPLHIMNHHHRRHDSQSDLPSSQYSEANKYRKFHRTYTNGNHQQWVEQVWLPKHLLFNSSTGRSVIPYYPFELLETEDIRVLDSTTITATATATNGSTKHQDKSNQQQLRQGNQTKKRQHQEKERDITATATDSNTDVDATVAAAASTSKATTKPASKITSTTTGTATTITTITAQHQPLPPPPPPVSIKHVVVEVDYASKSAGAVILDSSPNFQGTSNLLQQDRDKYAIVPCGSGTSSSSSGTSSGSADTATTEPPKYVVIGLSEDILVKQFAIANYERYSSHMKEIRLYGSVSTNAILLREQWIHLGDFYAATPQNNEKQIFTVVEPTWARYLKVEFISHYGEEYYCTISQISVHGSTVLQGFHEQWNEEENHVNTADNDDKENIIVETTSSTQSSE